ncbi:MAG: hypothetical protein IKZ86_06170 [Spirochaetaceae bacterium]|nr:hypothetical protein [Spirochaetaceae bacterium]
MLTETKLENNKDFFADLKLSFIRFFKLLKYELSASCRTLVPIYCAVLAISVLTRFASYDDSSFSELEGIMSFLYFSLLTASVCITIVILCGRFKKSFFGREAYLNFSLPVSVSNHLACKLVSCLIWGILCVIVGITASMTAMKGWNAFFEYINNTVALQIAHDAVLFVAWLMADILLFFVAMCVGHLVSKFKTVVEAIIVVAGLSLPFRIGADILFSSFWNGTPVWSGWALLMPLGFSAIWFTICYLILRYKLNIE